MQFLKLFFSGAFVVAASLRGVLAAAAAAASHWAVPAIPTIPHANAWEAVACLLGGFVAAVWAEKSRVKR